MAENLCVCCVRADGIQAERDEWVRTCAQGTDKIDELVAGQARMREVIAAETAQRQKAEAVSTDLASQVSDLQFNHDVMEVRALQAETRLAAVEALCEECWCDDPGYLCLQCRVRAAARGEGSTAEDWCRMCDQVHPDIETGCRGG